ncbi:hypothetical protein F5Y04DRAFT_128158 [Hypomontagnella monticulosa]|nr:hypothetical protein F5Y04DRAFT_128158 [Hypomontagnella monticulosa]
MWFTILADLGRNDDAMPNMLARPELLESLSSGMPQANHTLRQAFRHGVDCCGENLMSREAFNPSESPDVKLRVDPSTLTANYLCQVPQLKSAGNLFLSVLVADLVILQVIWKVFTLIVDRFCVKNPEEALYCATCAPPPASGKLSGGYISVTGQESEVILPEDRSPSETR